MSLQPRLIESDVAVNSGPSAGEIKVGDVSALEGNPDFVLSLARGLKVIESFEGCSEGQSAADIARATHLSRAAVRRCLITLELLGYVESTGRTYRLKTRVLKLGFSYLSSNSMPAIVTS